MKYWKTIYEKEPHNSCYIEFLPGYFQGKWWNPTSFLIDETLFENTLGTILARELKDFSPTSSYQLSESDWNQIYDACLNEGDPYKGIVEEAEDFFDNCFEFHDCITILGM